VDLWDALHEADADSDGLRRARGRRADGRAEYIAVLGKNCKVRFRAHSPKAGWKDICCRPQGVEWRPIRTEHKPQSATDGSQSTKRN